MIALIKLSGDFGGRISVTAGSPDPADPNPADLEPVELPARRGFSISYQGKTLLSRIDPVTQGERVAAEIPLKEETLYFCPSPLYGYGLVAFLGRLPKNSAVLCVEADGKLFEISQKALGELSGANARGENLRPFALLKTTQPEKLCAFVRETWGQRRFRRLEEIRLGGGWQLFPGLYESLAHTLRQEMAVEWGNAMTLIRLGRLYARNFIRNLAFLPGGENITALNFGRSPVLVLGAGPSLDSILNGLSRARASGQRSFKIVCVDTCLPALHERSIQPDLAVILESQHWNLRDFSGAQGRKIDAAIDLSALPASARVLGGKRFFFATPWTELALFKRLQEAGLLPETFIPLGSVGLSAAALALRISSGPVLTGGIDFSYTLDSYHARSTPGHLSLERTQSRTTSLINAAAAFKDGTFTALSKTGQTVRSDPSMRKYRNLFEQEFGGNPRILDIAGSGLPLGIKTITASEAFAILNGSMDAANGSASGGASHNGGQTDKREKLAAFVLREMETLNTLRETLSGESPLEPARLEELLDSADYLWAHFPECAGTGGQKTGGRRPAATDLSFLKRVRTEIEPFLKCWEMALDRQENAVDEHISHNM